MGVRAGERVGRRARKRAGVGVRACRQADGPMGRKANWPASWRDEVPVGQRTGWLQNKGSNFTNRGAKNRQPRMAAHIFSTTWNMF